LRRLPTAIRRTWLAIWAAGRGVPMHPAALADEIKAGAATASYIAGLQPVPRDRFRVPAVAPAFPINAPSVRGAWLRAIAFNNREQSVSMAGAVYQFSHAQSAPL